MYSVFIVEDEHLIRESLRKSILELSQDYPISFAGEASDGEMALSDILDLQPDIILTDIRMPFMDGLALTKEIRKTFPWIRIIFISGYDDFEYAKAAIQVQADEYLLKPIKKQDLATTLEKVISILDEQRQLSDPNQNSTLLANEIRKNHFLNGLFEGKLSVQQVAVEAESFKRSMIGKHYLVLLASNQQRNNFEDYAHFSEYLNFLFTQDEELIFSSVSSHFIKILIFNNQQELTLEKGYQVAHTLIHELEQNEQDNIVVALGPVVKRISELPQSFEKAKSLLGTYGLYRTEKVISFEDNMKEGELSPTHPFKMDLAKEISELDTQSKEDFIQKLLIDYDDFERTKMVRFFILTELQNLYNKRQTITVNKNEQIERTIETASDYQKYEKTIRYLIDTLIETKVNPAMAKYQSVINHSLAFIDENFTDPDISLNLVSEELELSPSHFSTIFSQSLGKTFVEYITGKRIGLAKKLLVENNQKLADIALDIGYNDPNYFSYLFKKKEGISPKQYRREHAPL